MNVYPTRKLIAPIRRDDMSQQSIKKSEQISRCIFQSHRSFDSANFAKNNHLSDRVDERRSTASLGSM